MNRHERMRTAVVLGAFAVAFASLTVSSYVQKSGTWDETSFLASGYIELKLRDYRMIADHPPFLREWSALPLLTLDHIALNTNSIYWTVGDQYNFSHEFVYLHNDADRLLYRARFMIVLLGIGLGILLFCWARELFGFWPAVIVLGLYSVEPNILAHSSLVTTDLGLTCFIFGTLYFLWRVLRNLTLPNVCGLTVFFVLAQVSKFTALLLWPVVLLLLLLVVCRRAPWPWRFRGSGEVRSRAAKVVVSISVVVWLGVASWAGVWAVYGFRYSPTLTDTERFRFRGTEVMQELAPTLTVLMSWVDRHQLLPNTYAQGLAFRVASIQKRSAYLMGEYGTEGWWYYFLVAFLIKTPIAVLLLFLGGVVLCLRHPVKLLDREMFVLLPLAAALVMSTMARTNIGLRHILPVYPMALLLAGKCVSVMWDSARKRYRFALAGLCLLAVAETALVYPDYLAFFNAAVGGPGNGDKFLVDSNLDWGQDLKGLKRWMDRNNVAHINLSYFGTADPLYYGINCTHLPGAPFFAAHLIKRPQLPGYVAISVTNLRWPSLKEENRVFYRPFLERQPVAAIGHSIRVYWVEQPWW
jgi:4-amino-4-deoxy-L-arabinose transferase-like glycosyltransferase